MSSPKILKFSAKLVGMIALISTLLGAAATPAVAQGWPFGGRMPNVGAMSYDLQLTKAWSFEGMRMTGYASSRGGIVRWVHCQQPRTLPYRLCRLLIGNKASEGFALPVQIDLRRWLAQRSGLQWFDNFSPGGWSGSMETSGQWRWGNWNARGRFRYWR